LSQAFFGFNVSLRGLYTAQRSLVIVNHNINNVNTPGYSRQYAVQTAGNPLPIYDGTGMLGTGSKIISIERIRDEYIDFKYWNEQSSRGEWSAKKEVLSDLEAFFNEPSDSGFTTIMDDFYRALHELAKDPSSTAVRTLVKQKAVTLTKYFNSMATRLEELQADVNNRIKEKVSEINSYATQIMQLNRQIYMFELTGDNANDLRDQRTVLVDKLSQLVDIQVNEVVVGKLPNGNDEKHFVITIGGKALVDHFSVSELIAIHRSDKLNPNEDIPNLYEVMWADGNKLNLKGGELKGYLDVRDGNEGVNGSPSYKGIPFYIRELNQFVQTFAMNFNEGYTRIERDSNGFITSFDNTTPGHVDGYGLNSSGATSPTGVRFFTITGKGNTPMSSSEFTGTASGDDEIINCYYRMTAKNFTVSLDILNNLELISVSDTAGEAGNINILNRLLEYREDVKMFIEGKPEDYMKSLVSNLGIDSQHAETLSNIQRTVINQLENRRLSNSGVSLNEEMANLVKFQHAYNAAAKMITTLSEIYDTLINRLGVS